MDPASEPNGSPGEASRRLLAYRLDDRSEMRLVRSEPGRPWMDFTADRYANRCLPLLMANQAGWLLLNDVRVVLRWDGGTHQDAVTVCYPDNARAAFGALSHFGYGIVTWNIPYLFRTPPGWNLAVRGPTNAPKVGIQALDAVVETDWATSPFTMNWQMTLVDQEVIFEVGEPLAMFFPTRRGELESFEPQIRQLRDSGQIGRDVGKWMAGRQQFLADLPIDGTDAHRRQWEKDYFRGRGDTTRQHQTRMHLKDFSEPENEDLR
jgi:hypothetical protein